MDSRSQTPAWPYVMLVGGLVVAAVVASQAWQTPTDRPTTPVYRAGGSAPSALEQFRTQPMIATVAPAVANPIVIEPVADETAPSTTPIEQAGPALDPPHESIEQPLEAKLPSTDDSSHAVVVEEPPASELPADPRWSDCPALIAQLEPLADDFVCRDWAGRTQAALDDLAAVGDPSSDELVAALERLESLVRNADTLATRVERHRIQSQLRRASYALARRCVIWRQVQRASSEALTEQIAPAPPHQVARSLQSVDAFLGDKPSGPGWTRYLKLAALRQSLAQPYDVEPADRRELAREILARFSASHLSSRQRDVLQRGAPAELQAALRTWATETVDYRQLLIDLEQHELHDTAATAARLAGACNTLRHSADPNQADLAQRLDWHYRNANVRFAASSALINHLLPTLERMEEDVDDHILGAQVWGTSSTSTQLRVQLRPDPRRIQLQLQAFGQVQSSTYSSARSVTFANEGTSQYLAHKLIVADTQGIRLGPARATADSHSDVTGFDSDFDNVPLIGSIVRSIAMQQRHEQSGAVKMEMDDRITRRARERLDHEVHRGLQRAEERLRTAVIDPLWRLGLEPAALDMATSNRDVAVRGRLAGADQLSAHTPRPAPPDRSHFNVQIHQSLLNNLVAKLDLDGQQWQLGPLCQHIAEQLGRDEYQLPDDIPQDIELQFADSDAVRVRCHDDRVELTIRLALLDNGRRRWRDITARGHYDPVVEGRAARLVRQDSIRLSGRKLGFRDQVALRAIFTKVFAESRPIDLVPKRMVQDPRLSELAVSQFTITDGWIGVALSAPGARSAAAARPVTR